MKQKIWISRIPQRLCHLLAVLTAVVGLAPVAPATASETAAFETPQQAADSLVIAIARRDQAALSRILGDDYRDLIPEQLNGDEIERFLDGWSRFHALQAPARDRRLLAAGESGWTLPIPIVRDARGWRFDTDAGRRNIRIRRIGDNELSAMQAILAYHDAQTEYAQSDRDGDGILEYAQRFISTPGQRDGLYWDVAEGEALSPLGPLFAAKKPERAYHGYYYRILTGQGEHAPGGARDYLQNGNMVSGFALIAWPAEYGRSGIMSFMISHDGTLYEADLGPQGSDYASRVTRFDPDDRWTPVQRDYTDLQDVQ